MPTPISSLLPGAKPTTQEIAPTGNAKQLGKQEFLQLLVTQLKNQDPLNPMEGAEFSAQLAQFSSLEQLTDLNTRFTGLVAATQEGSMLAQTSLATGLIGKSVICSGNGTTVDATTGAKVLVDLPSSAQTVTVRLFNSAGQVVATRDFGGVSGGRQALSWNPGIPAGSYKYDVQAVGGDGKPVSARALTTGTVSGVAFVNGKIMLEVAGAQVPFDQLLTIGGPGTPAV
jgi:flagellar basal-body rod modification protein FlgD